MDEGIKKTVVKTMSPYSSVRKDEYITGGKWIEIKIIMLSEISLSHKVI
jgi:hypothetical protein